MAELDTAIDEYLTRYAATLTNYDATAAAELWGTPGMILDDRFAGTLDSREKMAEGLTQSYPLYQKLGLASVGYECLSHQQLADTIVLVSVRWLFYDDAGKQLTDGTNNYILRRDDDGLHAYVCIPTDETEKLQQLAAERGIDLSAEFDAPQ
ncbi:hypothetical protein [Nocardia sp. NPDC051832]|uniref:hypothetical protein n=1 Tax=Nocardia sp. NPDC051832 TaxID=3155673 RepID=UPI003447E632